jgi:hypothetical protein
MESAPMIAAVPDVTFTDGFGTRRRRFNGATLEDVFDLRDQFTAVGSFEFALRERVGRLMEFHHGSFAQVRRVERAVERRGSLTIVSDPVDGTRLSEVLSTAAIGHAPLGRDWALSVVRQLLEAVGNLHRTDRGVAHGALGPERIIITPGLKPVVADYVLGSAIERLRYSPQQYWTELGVATDAWTPRFDQRLDVLQIGLVALALLLGRPLLEQEAPAHETALRSSLDTLSETGGLALVRRWVERALQLDTPFTSAAEALDALDEFFQPHPDVDALADAWDRRAAVAVSEAAPDSLRQPPVFDLPVVIATEAPITTRTSHELELAPVVIATEGPTAARTPHAVELAPIVEDASGDTTVNVVATADRPACFTVAETDAMMALDMDLARVCAAASEPVVEPERTERSDPATVPLARLWLTRLELKTSGSRRHVYVAVAAAIVIGAAIGGQKYATRAHAGTLSDSATGTLAVTTLRAGATVLVDNVAKGTTPLTVSVAAGRHALELRDGLVVRTLPITVAAGSVASQYLELPQQLTTTGALEVRTQPPGARVTIDGVAAGRSPITLKEVSAGEHTVVVTGDHDAITQTVTVGRDVAAVSISFNETSPVVPPVAGWISVSSPIHVQVFEHDSLIGSSDTGKVVLPAGTHQLEIANAALGYRARRTVQVGPGKVVPVNVNVPNGALALNAAPWAEVWLDGAPLGATPIGNVAAPVGTHQVVFRHPTLGEQRRTIAVPANGIARLSVDLRTR